MLKNAAKLPNSLIRILFLSRASAPYTSNREARDTYRRRHADLALPGLRLHARTAVSSAGVAGT